MLRHARQVPTLLQNNRKVYLKDIYIYIWTVQKTFEFVPEVSAPLKKFAVHFSNSKVYVQVVAR